MQGRFEDLGRQLDGVRQSVREISVATSRAVRQLEVQVGTLQDRLAAIEAEWRAAEARLALEVRHLEDRVRASQGQTASFAAPPSLGLAARALASAAAPCPEPAAGPAASADCALVPEGSQLALVADQGRLAERVEQVSLLGQYRALSGRDRLYLVLVPGDGQNARVGIFTNYSMYGQMVKDASRPWPNHRHSIPFFAGSRSRRCLDLAEALAVWYSHFGLGSDPPPLCQAAFCW
jgi:hypothetical protein